MAAGRANDGPARWRALSLVLRALRPLCFPMTTPTSPAARCSPMVSGLMISYVPLFLSMPSCETMPTDANQAQLGANGRHQGGEQATECAAGVLGSCYEDPCLTESQEGGGRTRNAWSQTEQSI